MYYNTFSGLEPLRSTGIFSSGFKKTKSTVSFCINSFKSLFLCHPFKAALKPDFLLFVQTGLSDTPLRLVWIVIVFTCILNFCSNQEHKALKSKKMSQFKTLSYKSSRSHSTVLFLLFAIFPITNTKSSSIVWVWFCCGFRLKDSRIVVPIHDSFVVVAPS